MGVHLERSMEAVGFVELLAAPAAKRRWSDEAKGRMVAETLVPGVTVKEVERRQGVKANYLSSCRHPATSARRQAYQGIKQYSTATASFFKFSTRDAGSRFSGSYNKINIVGHLLCFKLLCYKKCILSLNPLTDTDFSCHNVWKCVYK